MKIIIRDKYPVIAKHRKILNYYDEIRVDNMIKGWIGEEILRQLISEHLLLSHRYIQNIYLKKSSTCEVDGIILMRHKWVIFEVKHTKGFVKIDGWDTWIDGRLADDNPLLRTNKMKNIVENIIKDFGLDIEVEFVMVYTHPDCDVQMNSPIKMGYILSNQIRRYLTALSNKADGQHYSDQEFNHWCDRLHRYSHKYSGQNLKPENFLRERLESGLACPNCKKVKMTVSQYTCHCRACNKTFNKNETVKENIIDYCILNLKNEFTTTEIRKYIGEGVSRQLIYRVAKSNFSLKKSSQKKNYIVEDRFLE